MSPRVRAGVYLLALALATAALLLALCHPGQGAPWRAPRTHGLALDAFQSPAATVAVREHSVHAEGADAGGVTLLRQATDLDATQWRYLRYRAAPPAAATRLLLVWSSSEGAGSAPLPRAAGTLDLARQPAWRGRIQSLGVAAAPVDYLHGALLERPQLELGELRLEALSVAGALAALWSEWTALRPWSGRSSNTSGFELSPLPGPSFTAAVAVWIAIASLLAWGLLGRAAARAWLPRLVFGGALLLGIAQVGQLLHRASDASAAAALAARDPEAPLAAQPQLAAAARSLASRYEEEGAGQRRVLVHGANQFLGEYTVWLLRTQDAAMLWSADMLPARDAAGDWRLVLAGRGDWSFDADAGRLRLGTQERAARLEADLGPLQAFRLVPEAPTP
jgi:hypothetical protein